jgi:hypothetical protein
LLCQQYLWCPQDLPLECLRGIGPQYEMCDGFHLYLILSH